MRQDLDITKSSLHRTQSGPHSQSLSSSRPPEPQGTRRGETLVTRFCRYNALTFNLNADTRLKMNAEKTNSETRLQQQLLSQQLITFAVCAVGKGISHTVFQCRSYVQFTGSFIQTYLKHKCCLIVQIRKC